MYIFIDSTHVILRRFLLTFYLLTYWLYIIEPFYCFSSLQKLTQIKEFGFTVFPCKSSTWETWDRWCTCMCACRGGPTAVVVLTRSCTRASDTELRASARPLSIPASASERVNERKFLLSPERAPAWHCHQLSGVVGLSSRFVLRSSPFSPRGSFVLYFEKIGLQLCRPLFPTGRRTEVSFADLDGLRMKENKRQVKENLSFFMYVLFLAHRLGVETTPRGRFGELIVSGYKSTRGTLLFVSSRD